MRLRQDASWQREETRNAGGVWEAPSTHSLKVITAQELLGVVKEVVHLIIERIQIIKIFIIQKQKMVGALFLMCLIIELKVFKYIVAIIILLLFILV